MKLVKLANPPPPPWPLPLLYSEDMKALVTNFTELHSRFTANFCEKFLIIHLTYSWRLLIFWIYGFLLPFVSIFFLYLLLFSAWVTQCGSQHKIYTLITVRTNFVTFLKHKHTISKVNIFSKGKKIEYTNFEVWNIGSDMDIVGWQFHAMTYENESEYKMSMF